MNPVKVGYALSLHAFGLLFAALTAPGTIESAVNAYSAHPGKVGVALAASAALTAVGNYMLHQSDPSA